VAVYNNILETIGSTPLVRINKLVDDKDATLIAKLEIFNPCGSVKDRIGLSMIEAAEKEGSLKPGMTIVEPTSGNTGIALAMVAAVKGYKAVFTMPETMSLERRALLKFLGAEIILTPGEEGMKGAVDKAEELVEKYGYFQPQQFENAANPEIQKYGCRNIAVEPRSSPVLSGGTPGKHKIQGIGAGFVPRVYDPENVDEVIQVKDEEAFSTSRQLARQEGILAGISAGANVFAAISVAKRAKKGKVVLAIVPDVAERYLSTDLFTEEGEA